MARYYAIATVLVIGVILIGALLVHRASVAIQIASVRASVPPKPAADDARGAGTPPPLIGDAPWALSVLPECFHQRSEITGPRAFVLSHIPAGIPLTNTVVQAANCTLTIGTDGAVVARGVDRLSILHAQFFRIGVDLGVYHPSGASAEFRRYRVK